MSIQSDIIQDYEISEDFKKVGYCRAVTLDKFINTRNNCISLRKNTPYLQDVNRKYKLIFLSFKYPLFKMLMIECRSFIQIAVTKAKWTVTKYGKKI